MTTGAHSMIAWLAYTPAYSSMRGTQPKPLGAHAYRDGAPMSICGYAKRSKADGPAPADARRCVWCARVERGESADLSHSGRGWTSA